jgi:ADP-ribosylation factor-like protein 2
LEDCRNELHNLLKQEKLAGASLLIFCNKQDIEGALSIKEIKNFLDLDNIETRHWMIKACSGLKEDGLNEGLEWILDDINSRIFMLG